MSKLLTALTIAAALVMPTALAQGYGDRLHLTIDQIERLTGCAELCTLWKNLDEGGSPRAQFYHGVLQEECDDLLPYIINSQFWCPSRGR